MSDGYMIPDDKSIQELMDGMPDNWDEEYKNLTIRFYQQHDAKLKYKRQLAAAKEEIADANEKTAMHFDCWMQKSKKLGHMELERFELKREIAELKTQLEQMDDERLSWKTEAEQRGKALAAAKEEIARLLDGLEYVRTTDYDMFYQIRRDIGKILQANEELREESK